MNSRSTVFFLLLSCLPVLQVCYAQSSPRVKAAAAPFEAQQRSKLMILGTFHFNDGGNDAYKPKFPVDILSAKRQQELNELLGVLSTFKPTKVAIEQKRERQPFHDSLYNEFIHKNYQPGKNEIYQVCYRLAAMMGHQKVFAIDAPAGSCETNMNTDSFARVHQQEKYTDSTYSKLFFSLYAMDDSLRSVWPLKKTLAYENDSERLRLGLGHYLIGDFKVAADGYYPGADAATSWWNRNLRIFSNILQLAAASKEERIFVMIGSGHLQILRLLAMACPEIEFVDAYDYLK